MQPACAEDERLLVEIVAFLNTYFSQQGHDHDTHSDDPDLRWILQLLLKQVKGALRYDTTKPSLCSEMIVSGLHHTDHRLHYTKWLVTAFNQSIVHDSLSCNLHDEQ